MATGPEAVRRLAQATGKPLSAVNSVAKVLKQQHPPAFARAVQGGGKSSDHVGLDHLFNLSIALAVAEPITAAPETVLVFGDMVADGGHPPNGAGPVTDLISAWQREIGAPYLGSSASEYQREFRLLPGNTLREAITGLIDRLAQPAGKPLRDLWHETNLLHVELIRRDGRRPKAQIRYFEGAPHWRTSWGDYSPAQLPLVSIKEGGADASPASIHYSATLNYHFLEILADLWADTLAHRAQSLKGLPSPWQGVAPAAD